VGLDVTFFKMTKEGPVDDPEVKTWALANGLPDVSGGSATVYNTKFIKYDSNNPPANKEYVRLTMMFLENESFDGKVDLMVSLSRLDPDGGYKTFMTSKVTAASVAKLSASGMKEEIKKWTRALQAILIKELQPTEATYTLSKHVVDAENPQEIEIKVTGFKDKFGEIADNGTQSLFCIDMEYREIDQRAYVGAKQMRELLASPVKLTQTQMKDVAEKGCINDLYYCTRPIGKVYPKLTKSMGMMWDGIDLKTTDAGKEQITILCPIRIAIPESPVMVFMPGDEKALSFRVTTINDEPAANMIIYPIKLTPPSFGSLSRTIDKTDEHGFNKLLNLKTVQNVQEGLTGDVTIEICTDIPAEDLGKDESGRPIPWDLKAVQPVKISKAPMVNIDIKSAHKFEIAEDHRFEDENGSKREYRKVDVDEELSLAVENARLDKRTVTKNYTDDMGFKGTLIEYSGEATATIDMSKPLAARDVERVNGVYRSHECDTVPFDFEKHTIEHHFALRKPTVKVVVFYKHYIPALDSPVKDHPLEGLGLIQLNPMDAAMTYTNKSVYRNLKYDGCATSVRTNPAPQIPLPVVASNYYPVSYWGYMDDCYGLEEITVPLKEKDYMGATLRKWDPEAQKFDERHLSKQVNLTASDSAECWDVSDRTDTEWYEPGTTYVRGNFKYDSVADLVSGSFDLNAE
jgi:hypothetical protein